MYGYVYEITCKINNKKYIGQHRSEVFDESYLGSGTIQRRAVEKYGKENFEIRILQICESAEELNRVEQQLIAQNNAVQSDEFYNLINYGTQCEFSELSRKRMSEAAKRRSNTSEFKQRMSALHRGKIISPEVIARRVETLKRTREHKPNPLKGKKLPREVVEKMLESRKGYKHTQETRDKIQASLKIAMQQRDQFGANNPFFGKHHSEEMKEKLRKANSEKVMVNNGTVTKQITLEELPAYLSAGFCRGQIKSNVKRIWIHLNSQTKLIPEEQSADFLQSGWQLGRS